MGLTLDYQQLFKPTLDAGDWKKRPFTTFAEHGCEYYEQEISKWLKSFSEKPVAVV